MISIEEIKKHPWLLELANYYSEIDSYEKIEINKKSEKKKLSPKKNKSKHLSHNLSFYKDEDQKSEKSNSDSISDHSNHSDDLNKKSLNKKNSLQIKNYLENNTLNLNHKNPFKELEIKYFKEFASRKISIDEILKEQDDYGD